MRVFFFLTEKGKVILDDPDNNSTITMLPTTNRNDIVKKFLNHNQILFIQIVLNFIDFLQK